VSDLSAGTSSDICLLLLVNAMLRHFITGFAGRSDAGLVRPAQDGARTPLLVDHIVELAGGGPTGDPPIRYLFTTIS
jgi:hypothetical protein